MLSDRDRKEIEAGQRALYWARKNRGGPVRPVPKRDTQAADYGFIDGLMQARKPYPWPKDKGYVKPSQSLGGKPSSPPRAAGKPKPKAATKKKVKQINISKNVVFVCRVTRHLASASYFNISEYSRARLEKIATMGMFSGQHVSTTERHGVLVVYFSPFPETVTFYDAMGVHAARRRSYVGGGWRAYVLAKALDRRGLGMVKRDDLQAYALALGVKLRTWQRWINEARNHDLFIDIQKGEDWYFILPNPGAAAYGMGCEVGRRKLELRPDLLIGKGWKAFVWAATEAAGPDGVQMTRERLQKVYNVPVSTQRYRDAQAGIKRISNYSNSGLEIKPDELEMVREESNHKGAFIAGNKKLYWRLPDTRATDQAVFVGKGRARKARRSLRILQNQEALLQKQQGLTNDFEAAEYIRLFNHTEKQLKATVKKLARGTNSRVSEVYLLSHLADSGAGIWEPVS